MLPFPEEVTSKLDKGTVLRLTISYLRMKQYTQKDGEALLHELKASSQEKANPKLNHSLRVNEGQLMTNALNAFLLFVSKKGLVYCVSEDVYDHLGLRQEEIIGRNILEYIHPDDCKEFGKQFREKPPGRSCSFHALPPMVESGVDDLDDDAQYNFDTVVRERLFYIRMKCHVVRKGTKTRQTGYLLTQWSGKVMLQKTPRTKHDTYTIVGLLAMVRPMQTTPILEIRLDGNMFMSRHDLAMTFTFCDSRILNLVGYEPSELIGKTAYQFHNPLDAIKIHHCHQALIHKGTSVSRYYRFLAKNGDWVWMQTRATIIYNTKNEPQYVVCMNYVIGQDEGRHFLMMEQEVRGVKYTDIRGAIDVTNLASPPSGHTSSSGYSSEDDQVNNAISSGQLPVTDHTDMDSLPSTPSTHGGDAHDDNDMLMTQSHDDGSINMQNDDIPELCTDDISFDELVSSDAWLENMQPDLHQIVSNTNKVEGIEVNGIMHENFVKGDIDMEDISCDGPQTKGKDFFNSLLTGDATGEPSADLGMVSMDAQTTLPSRTWTTTSSSCLTATSLANSRSSPMLHVMERLSPPPVNPPSRVASTPQLHVLVSGGNNGGATSPSHASTSQQSLLSTATVITTTTDRGKSYVAIPFNLSGLQWQQPEASETQQKQAMFTIPLSLATSQPAVSQPQQPHVAIPLSSAHDQADGCDADESVLHGVLSDTAQQTDTDVRSVGSITNNNVPAVPVWHGECG
jgi:PAS domain S-box-containing protein